MEHVRFETNERVDVPDAQAMGFLPVYEFRRVVRGLMLGEPENKIINGFRVTPTGTPNAFVTVTLDPGGGGWLSHALGSEIISGYVDRGQLVGGGTSNGLGGNATYPVDFTGAPVGNYIVEMRFTLIPGKVDNRVFLNPMTKTEATDTTETRWVPALEVRRIGGTTPTGGGQWFPLAQIAWGGTSITAGNIIDRRVFAAEGSFLAGYQRNGWGATGGIPDFNRGVDRSNLGVNALFPLARALMRQVQDIKGRTGGLLDWFSRATAPMRVGFGQLTNADQVKGLAENSETCVFTVGDGVTEWGDFSGVTGLQSCLDHIVSQKANLPKSITIVLKTRAVTAATTLFTLSTPVDISDISLTIRCDTSADPRHRALLDFTHTGNTTPFFNRNAGANTHSLTLINLASVPPSGSKTVAPIALAPILKMRNCDFRVSTASAYAFIYCGNDSEIADSTVHGDLVLYEDASVSSSTYMSRIDLLRGKMSSGNSGKATRIVMRDSTGVGSATPAQGLHLSDSFLQSIDGRGSSNVLIEKCYFEPGYADAIQCGLQPASSNNSKQWTIRQCSFFHNTNFAGGHAAGGGTGGANGTGWSVNISGTAALENRDITIENLTILAPSNIDAGVVRAAGVRGLRVSGISTLDADFASATSRSQVAILMSNVLEADISKCSLSGTSLTSSFTQTQILCTGADCENISIHHNYISVSTAMTANPTYGVRANATTIRRLRVHDNNFIEAGLNTASAHVAIDTSTNVRQVHICGNEFRPMTTILAHVQFGASMGPVRGVKVDNNMVAPDGNGGSGTGSPNNTIGARLLRSGSGTRLVHATCDGNTLDGATLAGDAADHGTSLIHTEDPENISIQRNVVYGYTTDSGTYKARAIISVASGGMNVVIIGNIHEDDSVGSRSLIMTGSPTLQIFTNNRMDGSASHDALSPTGVWNVNNSMGGTVTPP